MIKRLTADDINYAFEAIFNLKHKGNEEVKRNLTHAYMKDFLSNPYNYVIVAIEEATVVGFLVAYRLQRVDRVQDFMCFYEIEVSQDHRRNGIGKQLIEALKSICDKENIMKMWVETNRSNTAAMKLYKSTGGQELSGDDIVEFTYIPPFVGSI